MGLLVRIIGALNVEGFSTDIACFRSWASLAAKDLPGFYNSGQFCDYPPFYIYVLFVIGKLGELLGTGTTSQMVKLPSILADLVTAYFLFKLSKDQFKSFISLVIPAIYVFNPVTILDSSLWGQVDSFYTMILVLALYLLMEQRNVPASVLFAVAVLTKPQSIFVLPVLLYWLIRRKSIKEFAKVIIAGLVTAVLIILPFSRDPLWIFSLYLNTAEGYQYASLNAFNLFGMIKANLEQDSSKFVLISYKALGITLDAILVVLSGFLYMKSKHKAVPILVALLLTAGIFMVSVRMHERYMFPVLAIALLALIYVKDRRILYIFVAFSVTNFINIYQVLYRMILNDYPHISANEPVIIITSFANVLVFAYLVKVIIDILLKEKISPLHLKGINKNTKHVAPVLVGNRGSKA